MLQNTLHPCPLPYLFFFPQSLGANPEKPIYCFWTISLFFFSLRAMTSPDATLIMQLVNYKFEAANQPRKKGFKGAFKGVKLWVNFPRRFLGGIFLVEDCMPKSFIN